MDRATRIGQFSIAAGSPGVDRGVPLPGFNDGWNGSAPDIEAQETGSAPVVYGVAAFGAARTSAANAVSSSPAASSAAPSSAAPSSSAAGGTTRTVTVIAEADTMVKQVSVRTSLGTAGVVVSDGRDLPPQAQCRTQLTAVQRHRPGSLRGGHRRLAEPADGARLRGDRQRPGGLAHRGCTIRGPRRVDDLAFRQARPRQCRPVGDFGAVGHATQVRTEVSGITGNGLVSFELDPEHRRAGLPLRGERDRGQLAAARPDRHLRQSRPAEGPATHQRRGRVARPVARNCCSRVGAGGGIVGSPASRLIGSPGNLTDSGDLPGPALRCGGPPGLRPRHRSSMTATGSAPASPTPAGETTPGRLLAEDPLDQQHSVLRRLQSGRDLGTGVRRGALWAAGGKISGQVIQFLGTIVTARLLTPDDYGKAAIILPLTAFAALFTELGLGSAVIHTRRVTERTLSTAFWVNAVTGVLLTGLVAALSVPLARLFGVPLLTPLLLIASLNFTLSLNVVHTALLERTLRFKQIAVLETVCSVVSIGTVVVTALAGAGPFSLVFGPLAYTVVRTVLSWCAVRWFPRARPDWASVRELLTFTRGITGYNILIFWSRNADNLLLARVASQAELGNYSRAYNLMKLPVGQVQVLMNRVLFPALARLRDDRPRLGRAWLRALSVVGMAAAPIAIGMAVAAPAMVEFLFGRRWLGMVPVLELLAVSALPQTLTATVGSVLRATGATDALFRLGLVMASLSLLAMLIGLPWGTVGVATALMIKFYLEMLVVARPCLRATGLPWRDLLRALRGVWVACLSLAAAGLLVRLLVGDAWPAWQVLLTQIGACSAAYVLTLALLDRSMLALVWSALGRKLRDRTGEA